ncbi:ABC transporter substrate-binding protein [Azospirillum picis]|uniref:NitT/TauT family transport system substrate-binding protein n=1 Tax=Azospirillum picis TaxID=488438 RepID=A0ABU0MRM4_9PROT|nr:ABC transporter substrate-binding protein [Azospirillum picis]MBP2302390.1 NitT/TauT family transport system substrate-binding protein [Azospirillum picis]MDQ0535969.1 NitT/TauT family transport system substrate-binding protein [Azospirillum picis]
MGQPGSPGRRVAAIAKWVAGPVMAAAIGLLMATAVATPAAAEGRIRIAEQYGLGYLPLHVLRQNQLIEKHGKALGVDVTVEWVQLSGGAAMNDALLSGSIDLGSAGVGPLLTIWDRTKGNADVKAIASLNDMPLFLTTSNPKVTTLKDFTDADKIALPAPKVGVQARVLQMAAEKELGAGRFDALDKLTVALPHPDATAALLSGSGGITAHLSGPPFQYQQLDDPKIHRVFSSYDVLGGPHSFNLIWSKQSFRDGNPKTYRAFLDALKEAMDYINSNHEGAADAYLAQNKGSLDRAYVLRLLQDPDIRFTVTPNRTEAFADFMYKVGAIRNKPASWKDYFFDDLHGETGS